MTVQQLFSAEAKEVRLPRNLAQVIVALTLTAEEVQEMV